MNLSGWAQLRNGVPLLFDESEHDVFNALSRSNSVNLWMWASCEPDMQRHPKTGDTVLHLLCRRIAEHRREDDRSVGFEEGLSQSADSQLSK
jgi:hypothetical protein